MRSRLTATLTLAALSISVGELPAQRAPARFPTLQAVPDLRIDATKERLLETSVVAVGPDGRIIVSPNYTRDGIKGFDSTGKRFPWKVATGGGDTVEIRSPTAIGWQWPNMFVIDPGYHQFAIIDQKGKVLRSIEYPTLIRPAWADRRKFPIFTRVEPLALYPDGSMLVLPRSDTSPLDTPEYDSTALHLVRVSPEGSIRQTIAKVPLDASSMMYMNGGPRGERMASVSAAFRTGRLWAASPTGARVAVVSAPLTGRDSGLIRVTAIGDRGDTVFSRTYPYTPIKFSQKYIDSVVTRARRNSGITPAQIDAMIKQIPKVAPPVTGVRVGHDQTIWLALRETAQGKPYLGLDVRGEPIGVLTMPTSFGLADADRDHVWGVERDLKNMVVAAVVRYKLKRGG